jgi:TonB family protein
MKWRTKVAAALAGYVLIASSAHAQATAEQLARCAAIPTDALRLQCYDALAKPKPETLIPTGIEPASSQVFIDQAVDERPEILSAPQVVYPDLLREAKIQGRVIVQFILDTLGRAEPASVKIVQSPNPGFDQEAIAYALHTQFRPARVHGRPVRVLMNIPIDFKITR